MVAIEGAKFSGMSRTWTYRGACLVLLAIMGYSAAQSPNPLGLEDAIEYTLLLTLSVYLIFIVISEFYRKEAASPLSLFAFTAFLHFGVSGIIYNDKGFFVSTANRYFYVQSIIFIFAFMLCFHLVYAIWLRSRWRAYEVSSGSLTDSHLWSDSKVGLVVLATFIIGWIARIVVIQLGIYLQMTTGLVEQGDIPFIGTIRHFERYSDIAAWVAFTHFSKLRGSSSRSRTTRWMWLSGALVIASIAYWLPTGKKQQIIEALVVPSIIFYLTRRALPSWRIIVLTLICISVLFPVSHMYRTVQQRYLTGRTTNLSLEELLDAIITPMWILDTATEAGAQGRTLGRLNVLEPVAGSIRLIETGTLDYRYGEDYYNLIVAFVPGFLWSGKPKIFYGNEFGGWIGQISDDRSTSISVTLPGEAYLNFGWFGAFVGALLALIFGTLYNRFGAMRCKESGRVLYATAIPTILYIGGSFTLYIAALIQLLAIVATLCWLMEKRSVPVSRRFAHRPSERGGRTSS